MRIAVLGAGPIGLEVATHAARDGHEVTVYEAGRVGAGVSSWGHVRMFTSWRSNTSELGRTIVGTEILDSAECPTGAELVREYLQPIARWLDVRTHHRVKGVARAAQRKDDAIGSARRADQPFRLLLDGPMGDTSALADRVVDCTGTLSDPAPAGPGGLAAPGEEALARSGHVIYGVHPVQALQGKRVLLVGDGASACTTLLELLGSPSARVTWITRSEDGPGFVSPSDDPLPYRRALWSQARAAVVDGRVRHLPGAPLEKLLSREDGAVDVRLAGHDDLVVDRVLVCTGYRPDTRLTRELQVHLCWASEGPMPLAAALLDEGAADCLSQKAAGADLLRNPEPGFFVLGSKSYGRRSDFLLQAGHRQVEELMTLLR